MKENNQPSIGVFCPNCGSSHVTISTDTTVSWGRAAAGWILLGPIAGAVGAVTGDNRTSNRCLNCGESWKASDLYLVTQTIRNHIGFDVNLSMQAHRDFLNQFANEVFPLVLKTEEVKRKNEKTVSRETANAVNETPVRTPFLTFVLICVSPLIIIFLALSVSKTYADGLNGTKFFITLFLGCITIAPMAYALDRKINHKQKKILAQKRELIIKDKINRAKSDADERLKAAEVQLSIQIDKFKSKATFISKN
jgi:hypothetical protein